MNLPTVGKKSELRERLKAAIEAGKEENVSDDSDNSEEDSEVEEDNERPSNRRNESRRESMHTLAQRTALFTIRDVEDSLAYFTGDDSLQIQKWISHFEDMSAMLGWNKLQNFVYGKRMLRGLAKQYITFESNISSWESLKSHLIKEFKKEGNPANIHSQLYRRRQQPNESSRKYIYGMQEIASQGVIEEEAIVQYIADGMQGERRDKAVLYGSRTLSELKRNIEVYERIREGTGQRIRNKKESSKDGSVASSGAFKKMRCYGCGSTEHELRTCPDKSKGMKCFKCNSFGHIAPNCVNPNKSQAGTSTISCVHSSSEKVELQINGVLCYAMLDTGSEVNIIRADAYSEIGKPELRKTTRIFTGFGNAMTKPIGRFETEVTIGSDKYVTEIFVVRSQDTTVKVLLGRELLKYLDVRISKGEVLISRAQTDVAVATERGCSKVSDGRCNDTGMSTNENQEDTTRKNSDEGHNEVNQEGEDASEIMTISCIETNEADVIEPYGSQIEALIREYTPAEKVITSIETKIILKDEEPVHSHPRRLAPKEKDVLRQQIDNWLKEGIIQPSTSEYTSPVVVVPKRDGSYRICIDYRRLNAKMVRDRFPMPLIEDCIDTLAKAKVFSVLDLKNGFFHVPVSEKSRQYTSFITPEGQFEFLRTPFGLCNSPANFLRFIDEIFRDLVRRQIVLTYMDDLIILGINLEDAYQRLQETLKVAAMNGLNINWKKCRFLQRSVEFLGHTISNGSISPSVTKIKAVQRFPEPKNKKAIQSFLGLANYFRKFIKDCAKIARPLSDLLRNDKAFVFGAEEKKSFMMLKDSLSKGPVLRIYDPEAMTEVHTDASKEGLGAVLLQKYGHEKNFHPVYYMSHKTSDTEKRYHSYELEILAVIKAIRKFRVYLLGLKFKLITDCQALQKTLKKKDLSPRVARWALSMEEFDCDVEHRPAEKLKHADALSRFPILCIEDTLMHTIRKKQEAEERLYVIKELLQKEPYEDYLVEDNVLMKRVAGKNVIVLPTSMQTDIIKRIHENGHFATRKVAERVKEEFYIPHLEEKIERVISGCVPCILSESKRGKKEGQLHPIPKGDSPLSTYHLDHLGPMTMTSKLYKHILVITDGFSKFSWLYPTKTTSAKEVINKLITQQQTFGNPARIITDRGPAFTSTQFKDYCTAEGIEHILTTTGVPRGNGQVERTNRIIISVLTKLSLDAPDKWYRNVDKVQRSINSTYQRSAGSTPFKVMIGVNMRQREDVPILALIEKEAIEQFAEERDELRQLVKENLLKSQEENRRNHNRRCKKATVYRAGDLVVIKRTQFAPGLKIQRKFLGPYKVSKVKGNDRYEVIRLGEGEGPKVTSTATDYMKAFDEYSAGSEKNAGMAECEERDLVRP